MGENLGAQDRTTDLMTGRSARVNRHPLNRHYPLPKIGAGFSFRQTQHMRMGHSRRFNLVLLLFLLLVTVGQAERFPTGSEKTRVWDYPKVLDDSAKVRLKEATEEFQAKHKTGLWVVIIKELEHYESSPERIAYYSEGFLKQKLTEFGADDSSILFLVSLKDRKARIELGPDWGHHWDGECEHIMQAITIPAFRQKHYQAGIESTVKALDQMVTERDSTKPFVRALSSWGSKLGPYSPVPPVAVLPVLALSLLIFVLGIFSRNADGKQDPLGFRWWGLILSCATLVGGGVLDFLSVVAAQLFFIVLFLAFSLGGVFLLSAAGSSDSSSWDSSSNFLDTGSSSSSGGGGFDAGGGSGFDFGGGGGATGDW